MTDIVAPEPTPEQAALFARVRRMMLIAGLTTALAVAAVVTACYLPYAVFSEWFYLRFLLPALPAAFVAVTCDRTVEPTSALVSR